MTMEGHITIDIDRAKSDGSRVQVSSSRRTDVADFLVGKQPDEAVALLPIVFSICGKAHAHAAAMACGSAVESAPASIAGELVVLSENFREHVVRIMTGWNHEEAFDVSTIPVQDVMGLVAKMQLTVADGQINADAVWKIVGEINQFLCSHLFHTEPEGWLQLSGDHELAVWADKTPSIVACFINNLYQQGWQSIGATQPRFLPEITASDLSQKMHSSMSEEFISQPVWQDKTCETGPLARNSHHPLVSSLIAKYGGGLLARHVARLVDLAIIPAKMAELLAIDSSQKAPCRPVSSATGCGRVETARGQLNHSVVLKGNRIAQYKILAPTEWNFHPQGVVSDSLEGLCDDTEDSCERLARMIVEAIDPCVAFEVRVR